MKHKTSHTGIKRLVDATGHSLRALRWGFANEEAIRLEIIGSLICVPLGLYLGQGPVEKVLLAGSVLLLLLTELLNTAVEAAIDRISFERHELSGLAKDMGSAAVMVALIMVALIWGVLLLGRLF